MAETSAVARDGHASDEVTLDYLAMKRNPSKERTANLAGAHLATPHWLLWLDDGEQVTNCRHTPPNALTTCCLTVEGLRRFQSWLLAPVSGRDWRVHRSSLMAFCMFVSAVSAAARWPQYMCVEIGMLLASA